MWPRVLPLVSAAAGCFLLVSGCVAPGEPSGEPAPRAGSADAGQADPAVMQAPRADDSADFESDQSDSEATDASEPVPFRFAWPVGLEIVASTTRERSRPRNRATGGPITLTYTLRMEDQGDDLRIRVAAPEFSGIAERDAGTTALLEQVGSLVPDFIVTRSGDFKSIADVEDYTKRLREVLVAILPEAGQLDAIEPLLGSLLSPAVLNAMASEEWNAIVGNLADSELDTYGVYEFSEATPIPVFPGRTVSMNYVLEVSGFRECVRGGRPRRCVEVEIRSEADPAEVQQIIESVLNAFGTKPIPAGSITRLELANSIRVLTEPDGLYPHELVISKRVRGTAIEDGREQTLEQLDRKRTTYTYR